MDKNKARVTPVRIGLVEVEGLMLPDGTFAIAVSQVAKLFSVPIKHASNNFKALLGQGFPFPKVKSELNSKEVNILSIAEFEKLLFELVVRGNKEAIEFSRMMVGLSLQQLFSDAFGIKFNQEERQAWLKFRQCHSENYHPKLTKWFKQDGCVGVDYGQRMNEFKTHLGLPLIYVGDYEEKQLDKLNEAETEYNVLRSTGLSHADAMRFVFSTPRRQGK